MPPISFLPSNNYAGSSGFKSPFLPSLNYPGSSRYSTPLGGSFGGAKMPGVGGGTDYGVQDAVSGKVLSVKTGQPFTGIEPRTGKHYANGVEIANPNLTPSIDPNDPNQRYQPIDIVKSPAIAGATNDLLAQFKKTADASLEDFNASMKGGEAARNAAYSKASADLNIDPFAATTRAMQGRYAGALDTSAADYARLNEENAAKMAALEAEARGVLPKYDAAAEAIAQRQEAALAGAISRYKMGTGTPTSLGSAEQRMLLAGERDIRLPLEQAKIAREYDLINNVSLPIQRELANRETSRISQFNPYVAGQQFTSGTGVEGTIQSLKLQTAGMSVAQADSYLRSLGIPELMRQQILAGNISELGALAGLEEGSRYRGLQDKVGVQVSQPAYYNLATPGYPNSNPTSPRYPGTSPASAPSNVSPGQDEWVDYGEWMQNKRTGQWKPKPKGTGTTTVQPYNDAIDQAYLAGGTDYLPAANETVSYGGVPSANRYTPSTGTHSNSYYDAATGMLIDRNTGLATGQVNQPGYVPVGYGEEPLPDYWGNSRYGI